MLQGHRIWDVTGVLDGAGKKIYFCLYHECLYKVAWQSIQ